MAVSFLLSLHYHSYTGSQPHRCPAMTFSYPVFKFCQACIYCSWSRSYYYKCCITKSKCSQKHNMMSLYQKVRKSKSASMKYVCNVGRQMSHMIPKMWIVQKSFLLKLAKYNPENTSKLTKCINITLLWNKTTDNINNQTTKVNSNITFISTYQHIML